MLNNLRTNAESAIRAATGFVTILSEELKGVHLTHLEEKEAAAFRGLEKEEWMRVPAFHGIQSRHAWQLSTSMEAPPEWYMARTAVSAWKKLCVQECRQSALSNNSNKRLQPRNKFCFNEAVLRVLHNLSISLKMIGNKLLAH